jgi:molybdopterin synthase catalytic subunit
MAVPLFSVTDKPLSLEALTTHLESRSRHMGEGCGAVCSFVGIVRATHNNRPVRHLEYEAHQALAMRAFDIIAAEAAAEWPSVMLGIHHRVGRLAIGDISVVVAAAAAHRDASFRACRYGIERIKQIAPVWKHEFFDSGGSWVEGPVADPTNDELRHAALECACA